MFCVGNSIAQPVNDFQQKIVQFNNAVFVAKDSIALENLLAKVVNYGHSGGLVEDRKAMIIGALANKSTYSNVQTNIIFTQAYKKVMVVRHIITANEHKANGSVVPLQLNVLQTWIQENKNWKLTARQAVKVN